jgi:hypothetical protein
MDTRSVIIEGQSFNMTDAEIVELYTADAPDEYRLEALENHLADAVDGERLMDFNLDEWRTENRRKFTVMQYCPTDDEVEAFKDPARFNAAHDAKELTGEYDFVETFDALANANKCALDLVAGGAVGVWIDVLKPDGDDWTADYYIETHKGETR